MSGVGKRKVASCGKKDKMKREKVSDRRTVWPNAEAGRFEKD